MTTKFRFAFPPAMAAFLVLALFLHAVSPAQEEGLWRLDTVFSIYVERKLAKDAIPGSELNGWGWLPITNINSLEDIP